jgi:hypothetical protein
VVGRTCCCRHRLRTNAFALVCHQFHRVSGQAALPWGATPSAGRDLLRLPNTWTRLVLVSDEHPRDEQEPEPALVGPSASRNNGHLADRVSDADRDQVVTLLREHCAAGRLTLDEFSERAGSALAAKTRGVLDNVLADLPSPSQGLTEAAPRRARRWFVAVMSGTRARGRWRLGQHTTVLTLMGGCRLDLRQAEIEGLEAKITAVCVMGGADIIVPEGIDVELTGFSILGGRHIHLRDVPLLKGSPRIRVRAFAVMGGVRVRSRPSRAAEAERHNDVRCHLQERRVPHREALGGSEREHGLPPRPV